MTYPASRDSHVDLSPYPALDAAWRKSRRTIMAIRQRFAHEDLPGEVRCVAVSGSLGRMEQTAWSDADLIVVLQDDVALDSVIAREAYAAVIAQLAPLDLPAPKPLGVFATPTSQAQLCRPEDIGRIAEPRDVFGKRIQILLDAQPLFGDSAHEELQEAILLRYGQDDALRRGDGHWEYLQHDLLRYLHAMAIDCQWRDRDNANVWRLRNLKLQHSRRLQIAGLLLLLSEATTIGPTSLDWLKSQLRLTPVERMATIYRDYGDSQFPKVAACYNRFLTTLADPAVRQQLAQPAAGESELEKCTPYQELTANAQEIAAEMLRFLMARRDVWSGRLIASIML